MAEEIIKKESKTLKHYVDNEKFLKSMNEWKKDVKKAEKKNGKRPPVTDYIAECFIMIAEHLSQRPNFINYPFREDMVGDGIENCVAYAHKFDPEKSSNPFSYFTQITYYAFLRRIQKEKKQAYIKLKKIEMSNVDSSVRRWFRENYLKVGENFETLPTFLTENDIASFEKKTGEAKEEVSEVKPKPKKTKKKAAAKPKTPPVAKKKSKGKKK